MHSQQYAGENIEAAFRLMFFSLFSQMLQMSWEFCRYHINQFVIMRRRITVISDLLFFLIIDTFMSSLNILIFIFNDMDMNWYDAMMIWSHSKIMFIYVYGFIIDNMHTSHNMHTFLMLTFLITFKTQQDFLINCLIVCCTITGKFHSIA